MTDLIPRAALFGNPSRLSPAISPDGKRLAWLAPVDGVMNLWVAPVDAPGKARAVTSERPRPIQTFFWSPGSDRLLYFADVGGTEDFLLYGVPADGGPRVAYTPFEKTRVQVVKISHKHPEAILVSLNNRDARWHDVHRLDLASGALSLVWENPGGYEGLVADQDLQLRLAQRALGDGGHVIERFGPDGTMIPLFTVPLEDAQSTRVIRITEAGAILLLDSRGRDMAALASMDAESGALTIIAEDEQADIQSLLSHPLTGEPQAYGVEYLALAWHAIDKAVADDIRRLDAELGQGAWRRASHTDDDRLWVLFVDTVSAAPGYWLYDRQDVKLDFLFSSRPELEGRVLSPMHPREIPARDGLTLVSYLTLPPECGEAFAPEAPLPMVLVVHGGPWGRDVKGFNGFHQWLANRGYAVLSVNFRASTGFGKAFTNAGDLEWGRKMHFDLLDAVHWAIDNRIADPAKVAIMGGSYGGYATLAGMTLAPDTFACGVDIVGPSNLITLLETIPPYWQGVFHQFARRMGDPRTEEGRALLAEHSPLTHVENIAKPLLIGQGANDPRVNQRESDQFVQALKSKNIPVTYVLYPDEGHGFARPENRLSFYAITEAFLAPVLGGAYQPIGDDFDGSSLQILDGAAHVAGLPAA